MLLFVRECQRNRFAVFAQVIRAVSQEGRCVVSLVFLCILSSATTLTAGNLADIGLLSSTYPSPGRTCCALALGSLGATSSVPGRAALRLGALRCLFAALLLATLSAAALYNGWHPIR